MQQPSISASDALPGSRGGCEAAHVAACGVSRASASSRRVRRVARRVVGVMVAAVVSAVAGAALFAAPAAAGGVDGNTGILTAAVYNATPYTWTLVDHKSFDQNGNYATDLQTVPAATLAPGGSSLYGMYTNFYLVCAGPGSTDTTRTSPIGPIWSAVRRCI